MVAIAAALTLAVLPASHGWAEAEHQHGGASGQGQSSHEGHSMSGCSMMGGETSGKKAALFENYFAIRSALAKDSLDGVSENAKALADATKSACAMKCMSDEKMGCPHGLSGEIAASATALSEAKDLESARSEFGRLSEKVVEYHGKFGGEHKATVFVCDMAKKVWLQETDEPSNPYYGPSMAKCARKVN